MEFEKTINLTAYAVEYIDQREPKPRTVHTQTVVLDGGRISARRAISASSLNAAALPSRAYIRVKPSKRRLISTGCGSRRLLESSLQQFL